VPKPITEPGKGSYWHLDMSGGEGYKRPRKRKIKGSKRVRMGSTAEDKEFSEGDEPTLGPNVDFGHQVGEGRSSPTSRRRTLQYPQQFSPPARHPRESLSVVTDTGHTRSSGPSGSSSGSMSPASASSTTHSVSATYTLSIGSSESTMVNTQPRFGESSFVQPTFGQPSFGPTYYRQSVLGQSTFSRPAFDQGGRPTPAVNPPLAFPFTGEIMPMGGFGRSNAYGGDTQVGQAHLRGSTTFEGRSTSDPDPTRTSGDAPSWSVCGTPPIPGHPADETGAVGRQPDQPHDRLSGSSRRRDDRRGRGAAHK
jgi:hypothetical protein